MIYHSHLADITGTYKLREITRIDKACHFIGYMEMHTVLYSLKCLKGLKGWNGGVGEGGASRERTELCVTIKCVMLT